MQSFARAVQSNIIIQAILFIVLGLVLIVMPGMSLMTIVYLIGALFAVCGIVSLVGYFRPASRNHRMPSVLSTGIFMLLLALILFLFPVPIASVFSVCLGIVLVLCGVVNAVRSFELRATGGPSWALSMAFSILVAIGGFVVVWNPFDTTVLLVTVLGAFMVANGIMDLVLEYQLRSLPA